MTDVGMLSTVLRAALNELRDSKDDALAAIDHVADQLQLAPSHRPSTCLAGLPTERRRSCSIGRPRWGRCQQCGAPPALYSLDPHGPGTPGKRCAVCAAHEAADGLKITFIDPEWNGC
jgi:hypothetical protein